MNKIFLLTLLLFAGTFLAAQNPLPSIASPDTDSWPGASERAKEGTASTASIYFETDQSVLSAEAQQTLDALAPALLQAPDYRVNIEAYTDDRGTEQYNLRLAADRAASVQNYLAAKGLIADKTSVQNWGERKAESPSELGRQKSRRVDVLINALYFNDFKDLLGRLTVNAGQVTKIQPDQEQTITGTKGARVVVPAKAFVFEDGTAPSGEVEVRVQEAYDPSDFILNNLTTMSEGKILETGGMMFISAQSGGKTLRLADGMSLEVSIPNGGKFDPDMELFYAKHEAKGGLDWLPTGLEFSSSPRIGRVSIPIDPSLGKRIASLKVPEYTKPKPPFYKDKMRPEPKQPVAPYKPRSPQKPVWEEVQKAYAGGGEISRMSRKSSKKAKQFFADLMTRYQRDSTNYVQLEARYRRNLAGYEKAKLNYASLHQDWENELISRLKAIALYKRELRLFLYSKSLSNTLKAKAKTINRYETYNNLFEVVKYAAKRQTEWFMGNDATAETRKAIQESGNLYGSIIGIQIIDHYPDYEEALGKAEAALPKESYDDKTELMAENTGLKQISDSLIAKIREKQALLSTKSLSQLTGTADAYFATVTQLGWINCDRFYNNPAPRMEVFVKEAEEATLYAVCREIKAMMPFYRNDDGTYSTPGLPKGQRITVVGIKLKDGMPQYSRREMKVGDPNIAGMVYRSLPVRDLKEELKKLNI